MNKEIIDIEVYYNYFCIGIKDFVTKKIQFYEISEEKNDLTQIYQYMTTFKGFLITFNGLHYDEQVLNHLILNYQILKNLNYIQICKQLKIFSDKLINDDSFNDNDVKKAKYHKKQYISIDLFCYWSKMLRISKKMSLKSLAVQLGYPVIQELPYKPDTILKVEDLPKLRTYNTIHDLSITELLCSKMEEDIKLRAYILEEYKLPCWSMDAPKIASEYLLEYYCQQTCPKNIPYWQYKKEIRKKEYKPEPWLIGDYIPKVNFKTDFFKNIDFQIRSSFSNKPFSKLIPFYQNEKHSVMLSISQGGIHSVNNNQSYKECDDYYIIDADVAGLYPTLFRHYKFLRKELHLILNKYVEMIDDRTIAKRAGDKKKDLFLKLCNNAFSGLVDSQYSWLYSPEQILALRVFGQMIQLRFMEELNSHGIEVLFTNTDGTLVKCPKNKINIYHKIALDISKEFNIEWEFALLKQIYFANTNTYISDIKEGYMLDEFLNKINVKDKGKLKKKGSYFKYGNDVPLGDSIDELVIAKALEAYYTKDISPREFISNPDKYDLHIYDYCKSNKISKDFKVYWNGEKQQQLNRYYFSKNEPYLFKQKHGIGTMQHVNVGEGVKIFNNYEEKEWLDYKINYQYYISSVQKIIDQLNNNNQLTLF